MDGAQEIAAARADVPTLAEMAGSFRRQIASLPRGSDPASMWTPDTMRDLLACAGEACTEHEQDIIRALVSVRDAETKAIWRAWDRDMDAMEDAAQALLEAAQAYAEEIEGRARQLRGDAA